MGILKLQRRTSASMSREPEPCVHWVLLTSAVEILLVVFAFIFWTKVPHSPPISMPLIEKAAHLVPIVAPYCGYAGRWKGHDE
jgi:hypothetical protein